MKAKKPDRSLRDLFRHKLENAEIIPDVSVSAKLMKKLARREFMHFNPVRFNIYYLGGILAAGVTAALLLFSGSARNDLQTPMRIPDDIQKVENKEKTNIQADPFFIEIPEKIYKSSTKSVEKKPAVLQKTLPLEIPSNKINISREAQIKPSFVNDTFSDKRLFGNTEFTNNELQSTLKPDDLLFEPSVSDGCTPLKVQFINKLTELDSCLWTFGDGGASNNKNPEWIFDVPGEYNVVLKVFGTNGITTTSSTVITVYHKPAAHFEIYPENAILPDDEIHFMNYSADAVRYLWDFGDGYSSEQFEPFHRYDKYGTYNVRLEVISEYGCSDSQVVLNAFSGSEYFVEFPNAFIPNQNGPSGGLYSSKSDESAQVFHPSFSGVSEYHLKIFSKLGIIIFESNDINIGWDGYFRGQLINPGVYIWKVRGTFINGEPFIKMGDVTLLKN